MTEFMTSDLSSELVAAVQDPTNLRAAFARINDVLESRGYTIVETNTDKPWGAYTRISSDEADRFIGVFPFGVDPAEARLGVPDAELSPKILAVAPNQRLSWQYHTRRAERWVFLTEGAYRKSVDDAEGEVIYAKPGDVVQFEEGERHRLEGVDGKVVLVAEIWQHKDANWPSNEDDIVRISDDYDR